MNFINVISIIFAIVVMVFAMVYHNPNPGVMVDVHGMIIVGAGTLACVGVAFSLPRAAAMVLVFLKGMIQTRVAKDQNKIIIREMMGLADAYRNEDPKIEEMIKQIKDPFLKEAMTALVENVFEPKKLLQVLKKRVETMYERYSDESKMFTSCGKYPPAMGLMGAVTGMIMVLGGMGKPGAEKTVGPSMSVALVATLYGIALANLFIIPIGEHLAEMAKKLKNKNLIIVEGIRCISEKQNAITLAEELNSFLLPHERLNWKEVNKKS